MSAFHKAVKTGNKLRMAITGPAGSGKTYTALAIATALGGRIAVLDTEHGSASKYADLFDFDTATLDSFSIDNYISTIQDAEAAGYDILIIDSLSHAWAGRDGALEEVDRLKRASKSGDAFTQGWSQVTPKQNRLVDTIIAAKMHVIATMRTKMAYEIGPGKDGRIGPQKVGTAPIQRDGVEYEFDVVGDLDPDHVMRITKTRCTTLTDKAFDRAGADVARILATWLEGAAPDDIAAVINLFRALHTKDATIATTLQEYNASDVRDLSPDNAAKLRARLEAALKKQQAAAAPVAG